MELDCSSNQLTYLNVKNGNNTNFNTTYSKFTINPNLTCIQVDDVTYSNTTWVTFKDASATYSLDCTILGLEEATFATVTVYPVPTQGALHIDNAVLEKATLYDDLGHKVLEALTTAGNNNTIDVSGLPKGIYFMYLQATGATAVRKVAVE
jgi:Secretion system C-terminal sorting domain